MIPVAGTREDGHLHMSLHGAGSTAIVFVHGGFCDHTDWEGPQRVLATSFRIATFDLPGHGLSAPVLPATVDRLAESVNRIRAHVGEAPCVLVGHSLGCRLALSAYQKAPAGIAGLVLIEGDLLAGSSPDPVIQAVNNRVAECGIEGLIRSSFTAGFTTGMLSHLQERILTRALSISPDFAHALLLSTIRWDAEEANRAVAAVRVPLLVLQSTFVGPDLVRRPIATDSESPWLELIRRNHPEADIQYLPGFGHFPMLEASSTLSQRIGDFARGLS